MSLLAGCTMLAASLSIGGCEKTIRQHEEPTAEFSCTASGVFKHQRTIYVCGIIDEKMSAQLSQISTEHVNRIVVNSGGGLSSEAISLARQIRKNDWELEIFSLCLSACAHFILPSRETVKVSEGALIGFHHTQYAVHRTLVALEKEVPEYTSRRANAEAEFYKEIGASETFLYAPYAHLNKNSFTFDRERGDEYAVSIGYNFANFALIDVETIERELSIKIQGAKRLRDMNRFTTISISNRDVATQIGNYSSTPDILGNTKYFCEGSLKPMDPYALRMKVSDAIC